MSDKFPNNVSTPFTPSGIPSALPNSLPPQEVLVDPIPPLPSMSPSAANQPSKFGAPEPKVETVIGPVPPKPVENTTTPSVPQENPTIRAPGTSSVVGDKLGDPYVKKHHGLPKTIIAGVVALVFLVIALGGGLYLTRQKQQVKILADNCWCSSTEDSCNGCGTNSCIPNIDCDGNHNGQGTACCGSSPTSTPGGPTPTPDTSKHFITFTCDRCASDRRCQTPDIGINPRYSIGAAPGSCAQVDECESPGDSNCTVVSLCDQSCSGIQLTSTPGPTSTPTPIMIPSATPTPIMIPSATPTPETISANCDSLVAQMSDGAGGWITKTDVEFAASARPGDGVRFVCTGAKTGGTFTKSAFFINGVLHTDDGVKLNDTQFAVEYTIPAAGELEVESVLLHDTKGWVD